MEQEPQIAVAWGSPGGATAELSIVVEELTKKRPKPIRLGDLAGPNETIQILLNFEQWELIASSAIIIFGKTLISEVAKSTWAAAKPIIKKTNEIYLTAFGRFVRGITSAKHAKAPVVLGFPINLHRGKGRHVGIEIESTDINDITRIVSVLAKHGKQIEEKLIEWKNKTEDKGSIVYEQNSDCSIKLFLNDEGGIELKAKIKNDANSFESIVYTIIEN